MFYSSEKGISLFLTIVILAVVLSIILGLGAIFVSQIKTVREMENSVIALYAADSGVEQVLKDAVAGTPVQQRYNGQVGPPGNTADYEAIVYCCNQHPDNPAINCEFLGTSVCLLPDPHPGDCKAARYCIRSVGTYRESKRAIEVEL